MKKGSTIGGRLLIGSCFLALVIVLAFSLLGHIKKAEASQPTSDVSGINSRDGRIIYVGLEGDDSIIVEDFYGRPVTISGISNIAEKRKDAVKYLEDGEYVTVVYIVKTSYATGSHSFIKKLMKGMNIPETRAVRGE
jgi:hypothetical protein